MDRLSSESLPGLEGTVESFVRDVTIVGDQRFQILLTSRRRFRSARRLITKAIFCGVRDGGPWILLSCFRTWQSMWVILDSPACPLGGPFVAWTRRFAHLAQRDVIITRA